jgi:hypothetical protein
MTRLAKRVSLPLAALCFGVRRLDVAFLFASALAFQTVATSGTEQKKPNQSGVQPPHSKGPYPPMGHGKANPVNFGAIGTPFERAREQCLPMAERTGYKIQCGKQKCRDIVLLHLFSGVRGSGAQQNVGRTT